MNRELHVFGATQDRRLGIHVSDFGFTNNIIHVIVLSIKRSRTFATDWSRTFRIGTLRQVCQLISHYDNVNASLIERFL